MNGSERGSDFDCEISITLFYSGQGTVKMVGETSRLHSLTPEKANKRRKLV